MAKHPVVVYGASGFTGMLIMDWLIDQNIPFTAVGRNADRIKAAMTERVVRLESAVYEIIEAPHEADALAAAFKGAKVVCNTVGPFMVHGHEPVQAALRAGCHYIDTTGEQAWLRTVRDQYGAEFAKAGLLAAPSVGYMYAVSEIACELVLETPGIDMLETVTIGRGPRSGATGISIGSTASIFEGFRQEACYLWERELVPHAPDAAFTTALPEFANALPTLPWGGTSLPVWYQDDGRVRGCISSCGFYDNPVIDMVRMLGQKWHTELAHLPKEHQDAALAQMVAATTPSMPPRERTSIHRSVDVAIGRGPLSAARVTMFGVTPFILTGAVQVAAVMKLLAGNQAKVGFASPAKAFGHRYLLGFLEQRGLLRARIDAL